MKVKAQELTEDGYIDKLALLDLFPELKESEDERIRGAIIDHLKDNNLTEWAAWLERQGKNSMGISEATKQELEDNLNKALEKETPESCNEFLEKQGEQKPVEWHREDEQNLNACLGYIPDEFLRRWLMDVIHVKYEKPAELAKGEDYGIDGLYAAVDILQKTLGMVDGYQTDDGILEHKCAINAVKELSKQKPADTEKGAKGNDREIPNSAWSEEDENRVNRLIAYFEDKESFTAEDDIVYANWLKSLKDRVQPQPKHELSEEDEAVLDALTRRLEGEDIHVSPHLAVKCLKSLKERYAWKPSEEQMAALNYMVNLMASSERPTENDLYYNILKSLREQLKKLKE